MTSSVVVFLVVLGCGLISALSTKNRDFIVKLHNDARKSEPATNMKTMQWDQNLATAAQSLTDSCYYLNTWQKGMNTAIRKVSNGNRTYDIEKMFKHWMSEKSHNTGGKFTCCDGTPGTNCCHYTQIIWAASTRVGCGVTNCAQILQITNVLYMACYYKPTGNNAIRKCTFDRSPYIPK